MVILKYNFKLLCSLWWKTCQQLSSFVTFWKTIIKKVFLLNNFDLRIIILIFYGWKNSAVSNRDIGIVFNITILAVLSEKYIVL